MKIYTEIPINMKYVIQKQYYNTGSLMPLKLFHGAVEEKPQKACEAPSLTH